MTSRMQWIKMSDSDFRKDISLRKEDTFILVKGDSFKELNGIPYFVLFYVSDLCGWGAVDPWGETYFMNPELHEVEQWMVIDDPDRLPKMYPKTEEEINSWNMDISC